MLDFWNMESVESVGSVGSVGARGGLEKKLKWWQNVKERLRYYKDMVMSRMRAILKK